MSHCTYTHTHVNTKPSKRSSSSGGMACCIHHAHTHTLAQRLIEPISHFVSPVCLCVCACMRAYRVYAASSRLTLARVHFEYKSSSMLFFPMDDFDRYIKPGNSLSYIFITHIYGVYFVIYFRCCHFFLASFSPSDTVCVRSIVCNNECMLSFKWKANTTILIENFRQNLYVALSLRLFRDFQRNLDTIVFKVFLLCNEKHEKKTELFFHHYFPHFYAKYWENLRIDSKIFGI